MEVSKFYPDVVSRMSRTHFLFLGGKSAVLSALTVALGGKANTTGRGSGLKAFVREGQQYVPN